MTTDTLIVLGFGGHARSIADVALAAGTRTLVFVDANARPGESFCGFAAVPDCPALTTASAVLPAAGDNLARERQLEAFDGRARLCTLVSPRAYVGVEAQVGRGAFVAHHAHVGPAAVIADGCIVNTGAVIDHESTIGRCTHVSVNATVAGRCTLGARVFVGAGAVVIDGVTIADDVVIGAGAAVVADIREPGTYVGVPARKVRR
jgi:sugar O-acyltransferase (sialic acid O-acetyltransferase NeuD family)